MNIKDAVQSSDMVAGMLSVNTTNAKVLIDSSSMRCFISKEFADKLGCKIGILPEPITIVLANQDRVILNRVYSRLELEISGHKFPVSLIIFQLGEFDMILGKDLLAKSMRR